VAFLSRIVSSISFFLPTGDSVKLSILCVDDEIPGLFLRKMVLEAEGYRVLTASSGQEALTSAKSTQLDAVVLDFNMPEMNGGEVAERLRGEFPHLKIIMLSDYPEDVSAETRTLRAPEATSDRTSPTRHSNSSRDAR